MQAYQARALCPGWKAAVAATALATGLAFTAPVMAEEIDIPNFPASSNAWPYVIAQQMNFFKQAGLDSIDIHATNGGGADIRNLVAGNLAYAETALPPFVAAVQQGLDVKIVSEMLNNATSTSWVTMPGSPIKSAKDLKGKKIAYSNPQSTTQSEEIWMLDKLGYKPGDVTLVAAGGFPQALTLLEHGAVDVSVITEPIATQNAAKYSAPIIRGIDEKIFPTFVNVAGVSPVKAIKERPDFIRKVIAAHRLAVEYMGSHPKESAAILAKTIKVEPDVMEKVLDRMMKGINSGVPTFELGRIHPEAFDYGIQIARLVGAVQGDIDMTKYIDDSLLPADQRGPEQK